MARREPKGTMPDIDVIAAQTYIAFGQGTGFIHVSAEVVQELRERYAQIIRRHSKHWREHVFVVQANAVALGRLSAHLALAQGTFSIEAKHVAKAARALRESDEFIPCKIP